MSDGNAVPASGADSDVATLFPRERLDLFLLTGQSNMCGRGDLSDLAQPTPQCAERIWRWRSKGSWEPARDPMQEPDDPVYAVNADRRGGVGPGLWFADHLAARENSLQLGLVLCARGGTTIERWRREESPLSLYGVMIERTRLATAHGQLRAVLFSHGESDTRSREVHRPGRNSSSGWLRT